jgi:hypothetical protein
MNAFVIRTGVLLALTGFAFAGETQVRVAASTELRVAIVDAKAGASRDAVHEAFAASLGAAATKQYGAPVGVRGKCVGVDHAAFNLRAGVYDAVLVMARDVPSSLRRTDAIVLSVVPPGAKPDRTLYFLIANGGDGVLQGLLASAFTRALADEKFLETLAIDEGRALPDGKKIAAAQ